MNKISTAPQGLSEVQLKQIERLIRRNDTKLEKERETRKKRAKELEALKKDGRVFWKDVLQALELPLLVVEGTFDFVFKLLETWPMYLTLLGVAYFFIGLRWLAMNATPIFVIIVAALTVFYEAFAGVYDAVAGVVDFFGGHMPILDPFLAEEEFFGGPWYKDAVNAKTLCAPFDDWQSVFGFYMGQATSVTLCPFLRYLTPVPWLYDLFDNLLGWLTLDPAPEGNNCEINDGDWFCAVLSSGALVLNLLVPLLLGAQIFNSYRKVIKEILLFIFDIIEFVVRFLFEKLLRGTVRDLGSEYENLKRFFVHRLRVRRSRSF